MTHTLRLFGFFYLVASIILAVAVFFVFGTIAIPSFDGTTITTTEQYSPAGLGAAVLTVIQGVAIWVTLRAIASIVEAVERIERRLRHSPSLS